MGSGKFWSSPEMEPKRTFRFRMNVGDVCFYLVKTAGRPKFTMTQKDHHYLNHILKFPSKVEWEDVDVTLVDPIDDNSLEKLKAIIVNSGYTWIDPDANLTSSDLQTVSKRKAVAALAIGSGKGLMMEQLDSDGNVVDRWTFRNAWISGMSPNENQYESDDLSDVTLTITYDFAKLETFTVDA